MTLKLINSKTKNKLFIGITKEVMSFHFSVKCFDEKVPATKKSPDEPPCRRGTAGKKLQTKK